jgi:hypothetical protein
MLPKKLSMWLAIAAAGWLPLSLLLNPGWYTLLLFSPLVCASPAPLLVPLLNLSYPAGCLPYLESCLELAFYASWMSIGVFTVNFDDTPDGARSIFAEVMGAPGDRALLTRSEHFAHVATELSIGLLVLVAVAPAVRRVLRAARLI